MEHISKTLNNGICLIFVKSNVKDTIAVGFFVKAGSRNETDDNSGIAHFLEHMMLKGTKARTPDKIFYQLDKMGTNYNAVTSNELTHYYIYGTASYTHEIIDILVDIYCNPVFSPDEINRERQVIFDEARMRMDSPNYSLIMQLHTTMFKSTSLGRSILGTVDTLNSISQLDLINFRNIWYNPTNTVFVIVGDFDDSIIQLMIKKLSGISNNDLIESAPTYINEGKHIHDIMRQQKIPNIKIISDSNLQQTYVLIAFPMFDLYEYKNLEIDLIAQILTSGFSSRLSKTLRELHGLVYDISSYPMVYSDASVYLIQFTTSSVKLELALTMLFDELHKIKTTLVDSDELEKAINITKTEKLYSLINPLNLLVYFGTTFLYNRYYKVDTNAYINKLQQIKAEDIQKISDNIFNPDRLNLFIRGQKYTGNINFDF